MRRGWTLVELLLVTAILAVLIGLLIPAVQRARASAALEQSQNNIRQICLGLQCIAAENDGRLPSTVPGSRYFRSRVWTELLPYVGEGPLFEQLLSDALPPGRERWQLPVATYVNPLDPSWCVPNPNIKGLGNASTWGVSSYAMNAQFFSLEPRMNKITDGTSQTIWIAEHYGWNCGGTTFVYLISGSSRWLDMQPANFAMVEGRPKPGDYYPITAGNPPISTASDPKLSFQTAPTLADCNPRLPNASSSSGLQIGLADGSVRILSPEIAPSVFWGMVTAAGGELIDLFYD